MGVFRGRKLSFLFGGAIGAALAFFFDPDRGGGRRTRTRDMAKSRIRRAGQEAGPERMASEQCWIEPDPFSMGLHDSGRRVVGKPIPDVFATFAHRAEHRPGRDLQHTYDRYDECGSENNGSYDHICRYFKRCDGADVKCRNSWQHSL